MARITLEVPTMLAPLLAGQRRVPLEAATLAQALDVVRAHPALGRHVFDEQGALRQHVLCFHNETSTRWLDSLDVPLRDGDVLVVMQAVSGG
jgi:sulfur-carrier protein